LKPETIHPNNFIEPKKRNVILICTALAVITLAVYMQTCNHQFLSFDDEDYVTNNTHVSSGITGRNIMWAFTSVEAANWHPITWLSHMLDVELYGMNPQGHHLTSVIIHTVSSMFLLLFLFRYTGSLWKSSFVAFLFALHPLHVESVAWVAERKEVLSAFFWFLTIFLYSEYVVKKKFILYILAFSAFILGLMSKPMIVTLPIVMLLMDFWPFDRYRHEEQEHGPNLFIGRASALIKEKIPFFVCSLLTAVVTIYAQNKGDSIRKLNDIPFGLRIENALISYGKYIVKTLWPHDLAVLYPLSSFIPLWQVIISLIALILLTLSAFWFRSRHPYLLVGWFWFIVTLLPVIGLIQVGNQSMADRYSYIPLIGLFIMASWGITDLAKNLKHRERVLTLLAGTVIITSAALTWQQLGYWRDNISLYRHTVQVTTGNYFIHNNLGLALASKGNLDEAVQEYVEALQMNPNYAYAHNNLGIAYVNKGNLDKAIQEYKDAIRINPYYVEAHNNLGIVLGNKGKLDGAIQEFQKAISTNPNCIDAHNNLGVVLANKGNLDQAVHEFKEALRINPNYMKAYNNLEIALAQKNM
jgi:tetratricopeptide (TPR) repeat protein